MSVFAHRRLYGILNGTVRKSEEEIQPDLSKCVADGAGAYRSCPDS